MMKKLILLTILLSSISLFSQESDEKLKLDFYGFIKSDYWIDSRQVVYAREGLFNLMPKNISFDKNLNDINASPNFNFSAITSRAGINISGLKSFNADVDAKLEADFSGISNQDINGFRLRHAYLNLKWQRSELLLGQTWHPMFVTDLFPRVISLNTGAPFQAFNRSPLARFSFKNNNFKLIFAAIAQRDYANFGPNGRSFEYLSNAVAPNMHLQLQYKLNNQILGIAVDAKSLRPELISDSNFINKNKVNSISFMAYYLFSNDRIDFRLKAIYGQNLSDQLMLGGYAVKSIDTITAVKTYTPTNHVFVYLNPVFKRKMKNKNKIHYGLFLGYAQNLGTSDENAGIYYATGADIRSLFRIAPSLSIISNKTQFCLEYEFTSAQYGIADKNGIVDNLNLVSNSRLLFTGFYFF
jgi:hypothetical protein